MFFFKERYDYSQSMDFNDFVKPEFINDGYSKRYGKFEFYCFSDAKIHDELFGHVFKKVRWNEYYNTATKYIDEYGDVYIKEGVATQKNYIIIYRRSLETIEDEILRFAHYCKYFVTSFFERMRANIRNSRQSGNPLPPDYIKDYEHFEHTYIRNRGFLADKHVIFEAKQYVDTLVEKYDYIPFEYDFVSEIVGPEESKAQTIFEREKIHLTYLLSCMNGDDKEHRSAQTYIKAADKARTKSKVFLALFLLCLIGGFAALVGGSMLNAQIVSGGGPEENVGVYITGIGFVAMIVSIVFFIMMIVNKKKSRR